jgi:putative adenylate-forming enzyme
MRSVARIAATFTRARWGYRFADRDKLLSWQQQQVNRFLDTHLELGKFYREYLGARLRDLPIVDKATMLANFDGFNVAGISLDQAISVAEAAERTRDFAPTIDGLTVGLSSGTSGTRGVFLVSAEERDRWVGLTLDRVLAPATLRRLVDPTSEPPFEASLL